ncbi:ABC transporter permease [Cohnella rhizosphaerae]|uniref:ABC transporter permease subunit n=1 Tax=Cohnella rhizosphaerae TaxID=1457232 RepID=A0A9X4KZC7_9BACL|nr:ABC transporter permease subunit [Cohnella rhizosphaerae]MDG0813603.1 ABC transporter permease subunit [Cohnella rhizosphaerae]
MQTTLMPTRQRSRLRDWSRRTWRYRWLYLLMVPGVCYYLVFHYLPLGGLLIAFQDYNLMKGIWGSPWVGVQHFEAFLTSPDFPRLMKNTLILSVYRIVFGMPADIILALALNEIRVRWYKRVVQTITYGPYFLSWVIVYGLTFAFLAPNAGNVNVWLTDQGHSPIAFFTTEAYFRPMLILTDMWKSTGFGAIIYLAALSTINPEQYEAAVVDGASRWRQLWHVTLPGIREVFVLLLILRIGHILDAGFEQVYIFLNARVYAVGDIIDTWVFRAGIEQLDFSKGVTTGLFKSVIGFVLVWAANRFAKKMNGSGIW